MGSVTTIFSNKTFWYGVSYLEIFLTFINLNWFGSKTGNTDFHNHNFIGQPVKNTADPVLVPLRTSFLAHHYHKLCRYIFTTYKCS